jgi:hypothetical protein
VINLSIAIIDKVGPQLAEFSKVQEQSRILNFILARVGREYRKKLKSGYLSGQMLGSGPGPDHLKNRIVVYKKKKEKNVYIVGEKATQRDDASNVKLANIYEHAGGYTIVPKRRKVLFFVTADGHWNFAKVVIGKARPFMFFSFSAFTWDSTI